MLTTFIWKSGSAGNTFQVFPVAYTYDTSFGGQLLAGATNSFSDKFVYTNDTNFKDQLLSGPTNSFSDKFTYSAP
jgi:hypothetical protein